MANHGREDLHTKFIGRPQHEFKNEKHQHHLSDIDGTVGIDVSTILYQCLQTPLGAAVFDIDGPKVPRGYVQASNSIRETQT